MKSFSYQSTSQIGKMASFGLIVLSTDETLEYELNHSIKSRDVAVYVSRVPMAQENSPQTLLSMREYITQAGKLLPQRIEYSAIAYGCTSASAMIGHEEVDELIASGCQAHHYTNPLKALECYCQTHSISNIDILSPYMLETLTGLTDAISKAGISISSIGSFNEVDDAQVARISPESIIEAAINLSLNSTSEALFISCTNLRTLEIIKMLEKKIGKPILSSNQLLIWHLLQQSKRFN